MEDRLSALYHLPDIAQLEDVHLVTLREHCGALEERVRFILEGMSDGDRQIVETYIEMRDELELQSVKVALRWGKVHYI